MPTYTFTEAEALWLRQITERHIQGRFPFMTPASANHVSHGVLREMLPDGPKSLLTQSYDRNPGRAPEVG